MDIADTLRAVGDVFNALGITGVTVGFAFLCAYLMWLRYEDGKRNKSFDELLATTSADTSAALDGATEQNKVTNDLVKELHYKVDAASGRQSEIVSALGLMAQSMARLDARSER